MAKIYKNGKKSQAYISYSLTISQSLNRRLEQAMSSLGVTKKNLITFLILNSYDQLRNDNLETRNAKLENALREYNQSVKRAADKHAQYAKKLMHVSSSKSSQEIDLKVTEYTNSCIIELANAYDDKIKNNLIRKPENKIVIALLWLSNSYIDFVLEDSKAERDMTERKEYSYEKDKKYFLDCVGISISTFNKLAAAYVLKQLFSNTSTQIRNYPDFGFYDGIRTSDSSHSKSKRKNNRKNNF